MQDRSVVPAAADGAVRQAVSAGGFVFVSAVNGLDTPASSAGADDIQSQTRRAIDRLQQGLERAGSSLGQTLTVFVYLRRAGDFDAMNTVYRERFAVDPPTRTTVVTDLANGALVEM